MIYKAQATNFLLYNIKKGDTLSEVIEKKIITDEYRIYGEKGFLNKVIKYNQLSSNGNDLTPGQLIKLPIDHLEKYQKTKSTSKTIKENHPSPKTLEVETFIKYGASYQLIDTNEGILGVSNISGASFKDFSLGTHIYLNDNFYHLSFSRSNFDYSNASISDELSLDNISALFNIKGLTLGLSLADYPLVKLNTDLSVISETTKNWLVEIGYWKEYKFSESFFYHKLLLGYALNSSPKNSSIIINDARVYRLFIDLGIKHYFSNNWGILLNNSFSYTSIDSQVKWLDRDGSFKSNYLKANLFLGLLYKY